ncbi:ABC transporter ATP-binding protein [Xylanibacter rodentium]|uniref:ABC transporter ATP-binding protein n=1 Tax=Xylanibacter rodentium TaxID=2736289 RepID=UPI003315118A
MLEVKKASVSLNGKQLFRDLSFTVGDGEILCVMGPSGSGKTTLLNVLLGFRPLDGGACQCRR